jgi:hypothetical protein
MPVLCQVKVKIPRGFLMLRQKSKKFNSVQIGHYSFRLEFNALYKVKAMSESGQQTGDPGPFGPVEI